MSVRRLSPADLAGRGVACMIMALIAAMKKYITKDMLVPVGAFGFMLVWGVISLINSYDVKISFYGFDGRGEGLLAIIFYFCFFITALTIKGKSCFTCYGRCCRCRNNQRIVDYADFRSCSHKLRFGCGYCSMGQYRQNKCQAWDFPSHRCFLQWCLEFHL